MKNTNEKIKLAPGMALASLKKLFNDKEVQELYTGKRIGTIDIEITNLCNYLCAYCYNCSSPKVDKNALTIKKIKYTLDEAHDLDVRLFNIQGGEPMLDKNKFYDIANYARPKFKALVGFTNGYFITEEDAKKIADLNMSLCVKLDTLNFENYFKLTKAPESALVKVLRGLDYLKKYDVQVTTNSVATPLNYYDIPAVWRYSTTMGFNPFVARNHYHGRTRDNADLQLTAEELGNLFDELRKIDKEEFNIDWLAPIIFPRGNACQRYRAGVFVNYKGIVTPCSEADPSYFSLGNVKEEDLKTILSYERIKPFRDIYDKLHGACSVKNCKYAKKQICYGCRVSAADAGVFKGKEFDAEFYGGDALCPLNKINPLTAEDLGRKPLDGFK